MLPPDRVCGKGVSEHQFEWATAMQHDFTMTEEQDIQLETVDESSNQEMSIEARAPHLKSGRMMIPITEHRQGDSR
jgi:hypothetical protein